MKELVATFMKRYVEDLKAKGAIKSAAVEQAFQKVERHRLLEGFFQFPEDEGQPTFVKFDPENPSEEHLKLIYSDVPLVTRVSAGVPTSSTSQPYLVAEMLELLDPQPGHRVLEIGAGTGYNAALMQEIVGEKGCVTTIDIQEDVVAQTARLLRAAGYARIKVIAADGAYGYSGNAPYDRIVATVGCPDISLHWVEQLAPGGFMLVPLQHGPQGHNPLTRIWVEGGRIRGKFVGFSGFMSIQGELAWNLGPSFEELKELVELEKSIPTSEKILPSAVHNWSEATFDERLNFALFLSIVDSRMVWSKSKIGLFQQGKGACLMATDKALIYGEGEPLYADLERLCSLWADLGRPGFADWDLEFVRKERLFLELKEKVWVIPRKFTVEIARLRPRPEHSGCHDIEGF